MDHLDWFTPGSAEIDAEVAEIHRALAPGGFVFWRSAARQPWYNGNFERQGFKVTALGVRKGDAIALDRVNMCVDFGFLLCFHC
jgi:betaine lipid synthase